MVSDQHLTRPWPEECDLLSRKLFGRSPLCQVFSVFRGKDKYICKIKTLCKTTIVISYRKPAPPPDLRYQRLTQLKGKKQTEIHFTRHPVWPDDCDLLSVGRKRCLSATMRLIWGDSDPPFKQGWPVNLVFPGCIQTTTIPFSFKQQQFRFHSNNNNWLHSKNTHIYMWRSYSERRASGSLHGRVVAKMFRSPFLRVMALWTCDISPTTMFNIYMYNTLQLKHQNSENVKKFYLIRECAHCNNWL